MTGQKHVSSVLRKAVETQQMPRQLLFSGSSGLGKTTVARIAAAAILCETPLNQRDRADACLQCSSCLDISDITRNHPDVIEFDAASNGGKDDVKDITARASLAPLRSKWKIYIIDEAHGLSGPGGQAFLKLLEEPPSHVIFMLATTDPQKMLKTNRSRCMEFELLRPSDPEILLNIKRVSDGEGWDLSDDAAKAILQATDPALGVRGTLMTLEKLSGMLSAGMLVDRAVLSEVLGIPDSEKVQVLADAVLGRDASAAFKALAALRTQSSDGTIRAALQSWARALLVDSFTEAAVLSQELARWQYQLLVETPVSASWTDIAIARMCQPQLDPDPSVITAQLAEAERLITSLSEKVKEAAVTEKELKKSLKEASARPPALAPERPAVPVKAPVASSPVEPLARPAVKETPPAPPVEKPAQQAPPKPPAAKAPRTPSVQTTSPDAPKAPPKSSRTPPPGTNVAKVLDRSTRIFLGAIPKDDTDAVSLVKASMVRIDDGGITLLVPESHHGLANKSVGTLRAAAAKLSMPLKFGTAG